jgi:hypothetical protein
MNCAGSDENRYLNEKWGLAYDFGHVIERPQIRMWFPSRDLILAELLGKVVVDG